MRRFILTTTVVLALVVLVSAESFGPRVPAAGTDDGFDGVGFDSTNVNTAFGDQGTANLRAFHRFPNVTIPQGSTVTACTVTFVARFDNAETTCNANMYFQDADNPAGPTTSGELDTAFAAATPAVAWNNVGAWTTGATTNATTPDLSSICDDIFARGGWASGQAMLFLIQNNASSTSALRRPGTFEQGTSYDAELAITYTPPAAGGTGHGRLRRYSSRLLRPPQRILAVALRDTL